MGPITFSACTYKCFKLLDGACKHFTIMFVLVLVLQHIIIKCLMSTFSITKHIVNFKHVSTRVALCINL